MGGLYYPNHKTFAVIGSKDGTTRTSETLESTYDGSTQQEFESGGYSKANFDILYTMGNSETGNSIEIKVEASPDGTNYYRVANEAVSGATSTLTAREFTFDGTDGDEATIGIFFDIAYKFMRIEAKETGVAANKGTVYCECTLSGR